MSWKQLGGVAPADLIEARLQLHHAAQVVASAGMTYLEPQPDDSHPNLGWIGGQVGALVGRKLPGAGVQAGLRIADLSLILLDASQQPSNELALEGRTLEDAYTWLESATARAGAKLPAEGITRAAYEIPVHPVANGARFSTDAADARAELARWFDNGHHALQNLASHAGSGDVRCWPHHFDLGSLIEVETNSDGSLARSVGIGLSPGDGSYAEPYWYVSPWPYPKSADLPPLANGHWHVENFTSAILTGSELLERPAEQQEQLAGEFLGTAMSASLHSLKD